MANKINFSEQHKGKPIGLWRLKNGVREFLEGIILGYSKDAQGWKLVISQDGLFQFCSISGGPGGWLPAWVGEKPDQPKMIDRSEPVEAQDSTAETYLDEFDEEEGLSLHDIEIMAENIKTKRGPGRPPKADNGPVDYRYGLDERPDDLFDLTAGLSLGIGLEDEAYDTLSFEPVDLEIY